MAQELYGREAEEQQLQETYERRLFHADRPELVLLTGVSGSGKTTLARTLIKRVESDDGGFFCCGKFDQIQSPEPYSAFVEAFTKLCDHIESSGDESLLQSMRQRVREASDVIDVKLLVDTVPCLELILGHSESNNIEIYSSNNTMNENDARKRRFLTSFRGLVRAIATRNCPLVLFLDDLQWADNGSLDLLATLARDTGGNEGVLLLGACRGNEVSIDDYLSEVLRELESKHHVLITDVHISNFSRQRVQSVVHSMFPSTENLETLVELLSERTSGNMFHMIQLTTRLKDDGILEFDGENWHLDQARISEFAETHSVVGIVKRVLEGLPASAIEVLQIASCLGVTFQTLHLSMVLPDADIQDALKFAADKSLIHVKPYGGKFAHDRMQEATYVSIPSDKRGMVHALIATQLINGLPSRELDNNIFLVVNQAGEGIDCIQDLEERVRFAELCLRAGKRAVSFSAFVSAADCLNLGIRFLPERHWRAQYDLTLALYNATAEIEYCNANFEATESLLNDVFDNARSFDDKIQAYNTFVFALGAQERFSEAIKTAFEALEKLGETFPSKPTKVKTIFEILKTKWMLRGRTVNDIVTLPLMTDRNKLAVIRLMNLIYLYAFFSQQAYVPLFACRIVQISLKFGMSSVASNGFGTYSMLLCNIGEIDAAYKFAQVSIRLSERFGKTWLPRAYVAVYGIVVPWKEPIWNTMSFLKEAHRLGCETGDIEFAMMAASIYCFHLYFAGEPIPQLVQTMRGYVEEMRSYKQEAVLSLSLPNLQLLLNYMGQSEDVFKLTGEEMDEDQYILSQTRSNNEANVSRIYQMHAGIYMFMNDYKRAYKEFMKYKRMTKDAVASIGIAYDVLLEGVIAIEMIRFSKSRFRRRHFVKTARLCRKKLKHWSKYSPYNFLPFYYVVDAEVAALQGHTDRAMFRYRDAIDAARKEKFLPLQALACERMSITLNVLGIEGEVKHYLKKARDLYEEWGFCVKVDQLDKKLSMMTTPQCDTGSSDT